MACCKTISLMLIQIFTHFMHIFAFHLKQLSFWKWSQLFLLFIKTALALKSSHRLARFTSSVTHLHRNAGPWGGFVEVWAEMRFTRRWLADVEARLTRSGGTRRENTVMFQSTAVTKSENPIVPSLDLLALMFYYTSRKVLWGRSYESISQTVYDLGDQNAVDWFHGHFLSFQSNTSYQRRPHFSTI